ncbi:MAG: diaminopropionate ammonia-lyase [Rubrivivax sp.]
MLVRNPRACREPYPAELRALMSIAKAKESRRDLSSWPGINRQATPLRRLPDLACALGLAAVSIKDESERSALGSFKALGAPVALARLVTRLFPHVRPDDVLTGRHASILTRLVVVSATDGNHGRALAAAAQSAGVRCVIVLHKNVSIERKTAIAAFGAEIVRVEGNYDESVAEAARLARINGWQVVSDTSYEGYEDIPRDVMQGYATIADELFEQIGAADRDDPPAFTHVILQGGVGGFAAGIVSYFWERHGADRPAFIVAEPRQADCLARSALLGRPTASSGTIDSVMAGLACGETSPLAWRFLDRSIDFFHTIADDDAIAAMRALARGSARDVPIVSGESGAAGLASLQLLCSSAELRSQVELDAESKVLLFNTEGATAPTVFKELVGTDANSVLAAQSRWIERHRIREPS